jgi:hypothetical protein
VDVDSNEMVWSWASLQKNGDGSMETKGRRVSNWSTCFLTSAILFPLLLGLNTVYKLPAKKTLMRSVVDALLLNVFAMEFDRGVRRKRDYLMNGTLL